jgi:formylglycine-generating enzyme required for sulfatase activity
LQYEYVEGGDLGGLILDWHRQAQKPSPERIAKELLRLAEIVAVGHRIDPPIVHRDLKPANILIKRLSNGEIAYKITDFGIGGIASSRAIQASRQVTSPSQFLTTAVRGSGSYLYASPEQFEGKDPDPRDDVHALGVIWYQMMTGNLTRGPSVGQGWRRRFLDQGLSAGLLELLGSCFEEQEDRPADAAVLAEKLAAFLSPPVVEAPLGPIKPELVKPPEFLTPPVVEVKTESPPNPIRPQPVRSSEPPKENENTIGMKLKLIPAGEFLMGSPDSDKDAWSGEKPQHRVRITQPFYLGIHQVTRGQYRRFVEATYYQIEAEKDGKVMWTSTGFEQTEDHPVVNVSWNDASAFCEWLSQQEGQQYRLPTEAEWEYACRAKTTTRFCFGDDEKLLVQYGWYSGNSNKQTHPVGEKKANAFGLKDMHGNVWEWCRDGFDVGYYKNSQNWGTDDPLGPEKALNRVSRGGGWDNEPCRARSASRDWFTPEYRRSSLGFRVVRVQSVR